MTVMKQGEDTGKTRMWNDYFLRIFKMTVIFSVFLFLMFSMQGCSTQDYNKPYPKYIKPKCMKDYIMYCEGRHTDRMECVCVKRSALERELRNLRF